MRILFINYEYPPLGGGAGNAMRHIGSELARRGESVFVLTSRFKGLPPTENADGVHVIRIPAFRRYKNKSNPFQMTCFILSACWRLFWNRKKIRPDVSAAFLGIPSGPPALFLSFLSRIPYIVSLRGGDVPGTQPEQLAFFHKMTKPLIKLIWKRAAFVVANSVGLAALARKTSPELDIPVIPNGVDLDTYRPPDNDEKQEKAPFRFLFVGRASREKNLPEALEALSRLKKFSWTFQIVGDGPMLQSWKGAAHRLGIEDRVEFSGWRPRGKLPDIYRNCHAFLFPSTSEGMPNVVLEALASGLPVIATRIRGNVDLVCHDKSGFLYDPGDRAALSHYLLNYMRDAALRSRLSREARIRAEQFSWEKAALSYRDLLEEASRD